MQPAVSIFTDLHFVSKVEVLMYAVPGSRNTIYRAPGKLETMTEMFIVDT